MDDCHIYLICLDRRGELLWKDEVGGVFTQPGYALSDLDGDGDLEICSRFESGDRAGKSTRFELQIRDGGNGKVKTFYSLPTEFGPPVLADFDRDGENEILAANANGQIDLFDGRLQLLRSAGLGRASRLAESSRSSMSMETERRRSS